MYDFIDVNEYQSGSILPSEALMINGEYIEDQIQGYRTLYVKGREMLNKAVTTQTVESRDGADFRYSRYPERTITVGYVLEAADNAAFRAAFNQLNAILSVDQSLLVFADESDKFFRGTLSGIEDVTPGRNTVRGEFSFICSDPFKYSLQEYEASPNEDDGTTFVIDYKGAYKSFPTLEATIDTGDCGYIAFLNDNAHIIQLGDPEETEGESLESSSDYRKQLPDSNERHDHDWSEYLQRQHADWRHTDGQSEYHDTGFNSAIRICHNCFRGCQRFVKFWLCSDEIKTQNRDVSIWFL